MVELVIKIPKDTYTDIIESGYIEHRYIWDEDKEEAIRAIKNGTPLPKGRGDLIDSNVLCEQYERTNGDLYQALDLTPIIIEAERRIKNENNKNKSSL